MVAPRAANSRGNECRIHVISFHRRGGWEGSGSRQDTADEPDWRAIQFRQTESLESVYLAPLGGERSEPVRTSRGFRVRRSARRAPACAIWDENGPIILPGHSGARTPRVSPDPMNTGPRERVHEPVFMASGPDPHRPSRNDGLALKRQRFSPLLSWQAVRTTESVLTPPLWAHQDASLGRPARVRREGVSRVREITSGGSTRRRGHLRSYAPARKSKGGSPPLPHTLTLDAAPK